MPRIRKTGGQQAGEANQLPGRQRSGVLVEHDREDLLQHERQAETADKTKEDAIKHRGKKLWPHGTQVAEIRSETIHELNLNSAVEPSRHREHSAA